MFVIRGHTHTYTRKQALLHKVHPPHGEQRVAHLVTAHARIHLNHPRTVLGVFGLHVRHTAPKPDGKQGSHTHTLQLRLMGNKSSPGAASGQKGLRLQFNSRQSSTVDT
eukprot:5142489-Pyramimonas_sp.AAC.1